MINSISRKFEKEELKEKNNISTSNKTKKCCIYFFIIMLILTILSNIADSLTVPKVKVANVRKAFLNFEINGGGKITANSNKYIKIQDNIRISKVYVKRGDKVKAGDILFEYDLEEINNIYEEKQDDIRKAEIEVNLGEEEYAERVNIDVLDNNYLDMAISGEISEQDNIIIDSNRNIECGDRIRVDDNE